MGCQASRANGCFSVTCCCCLGVDEACSWIAVVGLVWGGVATMVDFISANLPPPLERCVSCLDHALNVHLSLVGGYINAVQWVTSVLLLIGAKMGNRWLLLPWLAWGVVTLAMQGLWLALTLPLTPSVRAAASLFQLGWGAHFFIVVKTQYTRLALTFTLPEEVPLTVPPNTPVRRHKRRWRRLHPACQPPIRTLVGVGVRLQRILEHTRRLKEFMSDDEEPQEEEEEGEALEMIRITVDSHGRQTGYGAGRDEETCSRWRGGWKADEEGRTDGDTGDQGMWDVIVHSPHRDLRGTVVETQFVDVKDEDNQKGKEHHDAKDGDEMGEDEERTKDGCRMKEVDEEDEEEETLKDGCKKVTEDGRGKEADEDDDEEEERKAKDEYEKDVHDDERKPEGECKKNSDEDDEQEEKSEEDKCTSYEDGDKEREPEDEYKKDEAKEDTTNGDEGEDSGGQCQAIPRGHGDSVAVLWRASHPHQ